MLWEEVATIATCQHGIVTSTQLGRLGTSHSAIARKVEAALLEKAYPGVYRICGAPWSWEQELFAACAWGGGDPAGWLRTAKAVASHGAAARLHGLDRFATAGVEITSLKRPQFDGPAFTVHHGRPQRDFITVVDAIPVTGPHRTLVDLAAVLPSDQVEKTLDEALRRDFVTEGAVLYAIKHIDGYGRRGARIMADLLEDRAPYDGPSASEFQKVLRQLVLGAGFPFVEEYRIPGLPYRGDLGTGTYMTIVEGDTAKHHSGRQDSEYDRIRGNDIVAAGYAVLRFTPEDLKHRPEWILDRIERTLRSRGWPGPRTLAGPPVTLRARR
ncbi:MAG TPA: type IV toxin-antitoxin system AbiEi family antitoxin domain-containing protein [Actinomycetota bacterium]|nr:type IV toxin-antitoxin system AbiEi family antitoxin domain-containing protein [Actinomycetota bacterium]